MEKHEIGKFYSVEQVAKILGLHKSSIYRKILIREIEVVRFGSRRVIISEKALNEFINIHVVPAESK